MRGRLAANLAVAEGGLALVLALALTLALGLAPAAPAAGDTWLPLAPEGVGFQAALPGEPEYLQSASLTPAGRVVEHLYRLEGPDASYWITWTDLPRLASWVTSAQDIYENVRDDFLGRGAVRELRFLKLERFGHAGRELHYLQAEQTAEAGDGEYDAWGRLQVFLVGRRLFVFDAVAHHSEARSDLERFFASLELPGGGDEEAHAQ